MRIASEIPNYGMSCATDLQHNIATIVAQESITKVIETGTFQGLGTTKAVLKGMKGHGLDFEFISIEVNPLFCRTAIANNKNIKGLFIKNGLSTPKQMIPVDATFNVPAHIIVDHDPDIRNELYLKEVDFKVEDDLLRKAIDSMNGKPELVILDSVGNMGLIEFKYLMSLLPDHGFWLILDDTGHVKHYESLQICKANPDKFTIVMESDESEDQKSAIIEVKCTSSI
jgi:hypothetical protein